MTDLLKRLGSAEGAWQKVSKISVKSVDAASSLLVTGVKSDFAMDLR
jgi:hypothetical protein